jgi:alkanesulfonate monooxygenase SsuD/methylene tetrahydromethanopterin reductase-like flavin-dependent oxidoreductase (luciferase family)
MRLDVHDPWVVLGAVAQVTDRVRLGPMVTPLARRRPQKFAKEVTTLDHLSGGRVVVGVGLGAPADDEFAAFGEAGSDRERADRLDEALEVVTALWSGGPVAHRGDHFTVDAELRPTPLQRPRPPIWVAATWPNRRPLARAGRYEGVVPLGAGGAPAPPEIIARVAEIVGPDCEVVATRTEAASAAEYEASGATWLIESCWPVGEWADELLVAAERGPGGGR